MNDNHPAHPKWILILNPEDDAKDPHYVPKQYVKDLQKSLCDNHPSEPKENKDGSKH